MEATAADWSQPDGPDQYSYTWTIKNFDTKAKSTNSLLPAGVFSIKRQEDQRWVGWRRNIYRGGGVHSNGFLCVVIEGSWGRKDELQSEQVKFSILDTDGGKKYTKVATDCNRYNVFCDQFVPLVDLFDPEQQLLPNHSLIILFEIAIPDGNAATDRKLAALVPLSTDLADVLAGGKFSDCVITGEGQTFRCHKNILAGRSPVFDAMFIHDMKETQTGEVISLRTWTATLCGT